MSLVGINADGTGNPAPYPVQVDIPAAPVLSLSSVTYSTCLVTVHIASPPAAAPASSFVVTAVPDGPVFLEGALTNTTMYTSLSPGNVSIPLIPGNYTLYAHAKAGSSSSPPSAAISVTVASCPWLPGVTCVSGWKGRYWELDSVPPISSIFPAKDTVKPKATFWQDTFSLYAGNRGSNVRQTSGIALRQGHRARVLFLMCVLAVSAVVPSPRGVSSD